MLCGQLGLIKNRADQCIYQGTINQCHVILARATDDILVGTSSLDTYNHIVTTLESHWKIHNMGQVSHFFGLRFLFSSNCMTIDQTHMVHEMILQYVYGSSWNKQIISRTNMIPMLSGVQHEEALASCIPYSPSELHKAIQLYGFEYRTLLGQFQHLCQWTRLDIQTSVQRLAQYQNAPGSLHFDALLQIAKHLRQYLDIPLAFNRKVSRGSTVSVSHISQAAPWLGEPTVISVEAHQFDKDQTFWHMPRIMTSLISTSSVSTSLSSTLQEQKHFSNISKPLLGIAPTTKGYADANFGGAIFDRLAYAGGVIMINDTAVLTLCRKQSTTAYNTTEAELDAATTLSKHVLWLRIYMEDMSIPYHDAISIGEDNSAAQIIAHAGKLTRNVRHIATKTQALQENVRHGRVHFARVSSAHNLADHFTKALPYSTLRAHCMTMMGYQFIDAAHRAIVTLARPDKSVL